MGSNDVPPQHVPSHYLPVTNGLLQVGGTLWTMCYILLTRESFKSRTYGMPLFALAYNFAWEIVYAFFVAEAPLERFIFAIWCLLDCGMVYGIFLYGMNEWSHAPVIARNLGKIFGVLVVYCVLGHWAFARLWIDNEVGRKEGKFYFGKVGPDTTELGFWTAAVSQAYLSVASLAQLLTRRHTGGVSWGIWASRTAGSIIGLDMNYAWMWYFWNEAHVYFMSPFGIFLWGTGLVCDLIYPFVFAHFKKTERVLPDGSKVAGRPEFSSGRKGR